MSDQTLYRPVDIKTIEAIVKDIILNCYGVIGIADKNEIDRPGNVTKKGNAEEAVFINKLSSKTFSVDAYLIFSKEVKVSVALTEAQKTIKYRLNKEFPGMCLKVNVYAQSIR